MTLKVCEQDVEALVDVRDIIARLHDSRCGARKDGTLTPMEMAALRDCVRRINDILASPTGPEATP